MDTNKHKWEKRISHKEHREHKENTSGEPVESPLKRFPESLRAMCSLWLTLIAVSLPIRVNSCVLVVFQFGFRISDFARL
jgi:hypothetical protein